MGRGRKEVVAEPVDPTAWMLNNDVAEFILLHQKEVLYMCMLGYTFLHGGFSLNRMPCFVFKEEFTSIILSLLQE